MCQKKKVVTVRVNLTDNSWIILQNWIRIHNSDVTIHLVTINLVTIVLTHCYGSFTKLF